VDEALALAERLGDPERLARVEAIRTNAFWMAGDQPAALESGQRAVVRAEAIGHRINQVHARLNLGLVCRTMGDNRRSSRCARRWWSCSEVTWAGRSYYQAETALQVLDLIEAPEGGSNWLRWWRRWESNPRPETLSCRRLRR
jgi:hypothetical protein